MKRISRKNFKRLKQLQKPRSRVENRVTVEKFHHFFVPEDQSYWIYQYLSVDDFKFANEMSKKKKGNTGIFSFQNPIMITILLINNNYI